MAIELFITRVLILVIVEIVLSGKKFAYKKNAKVLILVIVEIVLSVIEVQDIWTATNGLNPCYSGNCIEC